MFRVELAKNDPSRVPKSIKTGKIKKNLQDLRTFASSKLNISEKKLRLFVCRGSNTALPGTEITIDSNISDILNDGIVIVVSNGDEYRCRNVAKKTNRINSDLINSLEKPPRWPYPGKINVETLQNEQTENIIIKHQTKLEANNQYSTEMNGCFPILEGNILYGVKKAIESNDGIKSYEYDEGYISFDYIDNTVFPPVTSWETAVQRECRGLIVSTITGKVLARRFHKFFNINQNEESKLELIDFTNAKITEKMDGSLVSPVMLDNGTIIWATKRARIVEVEHFVKHSEFSYNTFVQNCINNNSTPLFEWCLDTKAVGVLYYDKPQLILIGIRDNVSGSYLTLPTDANIPVVKSHNFDNINTFMETISNSTDREGVVVSLPNGQMYKLKCHWYVSICQASKSGGNTNFLPDMLKSRPTLKNIPQDKIWITVISNIDDVVSLCVSLLNEHEGSEFLKFISIVKDNIDNLENDLSVWVKDCMKKTKDRNVVLALANAGGWSDVIIEDLLKGTSPRDKIIKMLCSIAKGQHFNILSELLDLQWDKANGKIITNDELLDICEFEKCHESIKNHVLDTYLPRKLAKILALKQVFDDTIIRLPRNYVADEGKIKGLWEQFTDLNVWHLRVDLQPSSKSGYDSHNGSSDYAMLLVQYGLYDNLDTHPHGNYAGVLVPTEYDMPVGEIIKAMETSFNNRKLIKMKRTHKVLNKLKVFCDLDGVLVDFQKGVMDVTGRGPDDIPVKKMWDKILAHDGFFEKLSWTSYGQSMWNSILNISEKTPTILTGLPFMCKKRVSSDKIKWCKSNLNTDIDVITCQSVDKYKYSAPGHILIDDREVNGRLWKTYGGTFIHHTNPKRTLYELKKIYKKLDKIEMKTRIDSEEYNPDIVIEFITNKWPQITDSIVGIDTEWDAKSNHQLSIVQIATKNIVYIFDMINVTEPVKECLISFLSGNAIKVGFGLDFEDINRLDTSINNVIDLQELATDQINANWKGNVPSLEALTSVVLNKKLDKSKEIHSEGWNNRPLSEKQLKYAALDAYVLLDMYDNLIDIIDMPNKNILATKTVKKIHKDDFDTTAPVKIIYSGVFLTPKSRSELLEKFPINYNNMYADHVTIEYEPSEYSVRGLPIGEMVEIKVTGYAKDDNVTAVKCIVLDRERHITLSTKPGINPAESNDAEYVKIDCNIVLYGVVGVQVKTISDSLALIPERVKNKILDFAENALPGQSLKLKPNDLSPAERAMVHEFAANNKIESQSNGKDKNRRLTLTMRRRSNVSDEINTECEDATSQKRITDFYTYSVLNIATKNSTLPTVGQILSNSVEWFKDVLVNKKVVYILRGLPGSGKSTLSKYLSDNITDSVVCSADDYFTSNGSYNFDRSKLQEAHDECYAKFKDCIGFNMIPIIDNTNVTKKEYSKYVTHAQLNNCAVITLEIHCKDRDMARLFASRNSHGVSTNDVLKMLAKWETSDSSNLLSPFTNVIKSNKLSVQEESFNKWLSDMKLIHHDMKRDRTHLCMEVGKRKLMFLNVPDNLYNEFLERYNNSDDEPKFIVELFGKTFKMAFDIDFIDDNEMNENVLMMLVKTINKYVESDVYVTGAVSEHNGKLKSGYHIKCPDKIVNKEEALSIRSNVIKELSELFPEYDWNIIIDFVIYNNGLRMFGSRKATKGNDMGKVYSMLFAMSEGAKFVPNIEGVELLKKLSIHVL